MSPGDSLGATLAVALSVVALTISPEYDRPDLLAVPPKLLCYFMRCLVLLILDAWLNTYLTGNCYAISYLVWWDYRGYIDASALILWHHE